MCCVAACAKCQRGSSFSIPRGSTWSYCKAPPAFLLAGKTEEGTFAAVGLWKDKVREKFALVPRIKDGKLQVGNRRP